MGKGMFKNVYSIYFILCDMKAFYKYSVRSYER